MNEHSPTIRFSHSIEPMIISIPSCHGGRETCGVLLGKRTPTELQVESLATVDNPIRTFGFAITRKSLDSILERTSRQCLGVFHTHHSDTAPSPTDAREMKNADYPLSMILGNPKRSEESRPWRLFLHQRRTIQDVTEGIQWTSN